MAHCHSQTMGVTTVDPQFTNYDDPKSLGFRLRAKRIGPLTDLIEQSGEAESE